MSLTYGPCRKIWAKYCMESTGITYPYPALSILFAVYPYYVSIRSSRRKFAPNFKFVPPNKARKVLKMFQVFYPLKLASATNTTNLSGVCIQMRLICVFRMTNSLKQHLETKINSN